MTRILSAFDFHLPFYRRFKCSFDFISSILCSPFKLLELWQHTVEAIMQMRISSISDYLKDARRSTKSSIVIESQAGKMISLEKHLATNFCHAKTSLKKLPITWWKITQSTFSSLLCKKKLNFFSIGFEVHDINLFFNLFWKLFSCTQRMKINKFYPSSLLSGLGRRKCEKTRFCYLCPRTETPSEGCYANTEL